MQRILIVLLLLAAAVGVYVFVTHQPSDEPTVEPVEDDTSGNATTEPDKGLKGAKGRVGADAKAEIIQLDSPARALFIGKHQGSWPMLVVSVMQYLRDLEYRTWFVDDVATRKGVAGDGRGMAALTDAPTGQYLLDHDVEALFLDAFDPNALPTSFWEVVRDRVTSGRMGLYFRPTYLVGDGGVGVTQHPALTHPILGALLPVKRAAQIEGSPLPGVYPEPRPLAVTALGKRHPATRFVRNETASGNVWAGATDGGDGSFMTKFCYPVLEPTPGAQVLVEAEAATSVPALIATPHLANRPRVLWMGNTDFGQRTYFVQARDAVQKLLVNHWIIWLLGRVEE